MDKLIQIDSLFLMPIAGVGVIIAIILLISRRKKRAESPALARTYLKVSVFLFLFSIVVFALIPLVYFAYLIIKFGPSIIFAGLKSA